MSASKADAPRRTSAAEAMHEEEALGKAYDLRQLRRLWSYIAPYWRQVVCTLLIFFPTFVLELMPGWIIKVGLDRFILPELAPTDVAADPLLRMAWVLEPPAGIPPLYWLGALLVGAMLLGTLFQFLNAALMGWTGQSAMRDLRRDVFAHIQKLHLGFFDRYPVGRLVTRATNDVENVAEMFTAGIVALVTDLLRMVGVAAILFYVEPRLALMTFLVVPILAVAALVFRFKVRAAFRKVRVRIARINAYVQENVTGMKVIQLFTREQRNYREFDRLNADHRDAWHQSIRYDSALFSAVELASTLTVAIIIAHGVGLAAGTLYLFIDWMRRFFMPLRDLSAKYSVMQSSMASSERIFELLDTEPAIADRAPSKLSDPVDAAIEFENVSFAYQGDDWVLRDLSFRVEAGEKVAIVGATGAGKTTIIQLLARLYEATRGRVTVGGVDLRDIPQEQLRRRIALVLQDVFLFSGTVADNIALGRPEIDREAVVAAARAVQMDRFVAKFPLGYDSEVRERGANLSAGQRQLLSFARALAHGADILVLDEATSSIDNETEALIQAGIHVLMEGKTAIAIAHRLSTIRDVDRIFVLDAGRIVETGSHEELLALGGVYAGLYRLQIRATENPAVAAG
ncbi:MAG: ABC transporter ATP-binding protein [Deltaproteobacteria bacterium]|nr:ABC transporter ATP-binding protein [Deltaproteobacteria bacterium]